jgi:hypothetical protein
MSVTTPATAAPVSAQKNNYVKKPSQEEKDKTLQEIEANMEKIRPRLVSSSHSSRFTLSLFFLSSLQRNKLRSLQDIMMHVLKRKERITTIICITMISLEHKEWAEMDEK